MADSGEWVVEKSLKTDRESDCSMQARIALLVDDGIAPALMQHFGLDHAGERHDFAAELQRVAHGERIGMARHGDDVLRLEDVGLRRGYFGGLR